MAGSAPNQFVGRDQPQNAQIGDTWDNGAQVRILTQLRGWLNLGGPAVETNA